ncbi:MAG: class I SAM-dependent methyltransferase [Proteobacteria bacterium]|nr:class I SAM-dependent methyltransferase [Pseudomonadota bacterium]
MSQSSQKNQGYLHGFSPEEQQRLYLQARFLEDKVYRNVDFTGKKKLLEIGCGVGAQTEILLERFPNIHITGIDASEKQLNQAKMRLRSSLDSKKVDLSLGDATKLEIPDSTFDSAFICWLLEHVSSPLDVLKETFRLLQSGGVLYCTEVMNATLYLHPYSPATLQYWFAFNDHQWVLGGDPFVGAKLGHYMAQAGFQDIETKEVVFHHDSRSPKMRLKMIDYWTQLLLSGAPSLVGSNTVTQDLVDEMTKELSALKADANSVFYYASMQAKGRVY